MSQPQRVHVFIVDFSEIGEDSTVFFLDDALLDVPLYIASIENGYGSYTDAIATSGVGGVVLPEYRILTDEDDQTQLPKLPEGLILERYGLTEGLKPSLEHEIVTSRYYTFRAFPNADDDDGYEDDVSV